MKKIYMIVLAIALALALGTVAFAIGPGSGAGPGAGQWSPEQSQAFTKFQNDILPLRQKMLQLRTELFNLRAQDPVDWKAIAAKQKELIDVRTAIQQKAAENGFGGYGGYGRGYGGRGYGYGHMGGYGGGYGPGGCGMWY